jgi:hypothetical protein
MFSLPGILSSTAPPRGGLLYLKECRIKHQPYSEICNRFSLLDHPGKADAELIDGKSAAAEGMVTFARGRSPENAGWRNPNFDEIIKVIGEKTQAMRGKWRRLIDEKRL